MILNVYVSSDLLRSFVNELFGCQWKLEKMPRPTQPPACAPPAPAAPGWVRQARGSDPARACTAPAPGAERSTATRTSAPPCRRPCGSRPGPGHRVPAAAVLPGNDGG